MEPAGGVPDRDSPVLSGSPQAPLIFLLSRKLAGAAGAGAAGAGVGAGDSAAASRTPPLQRVDVTKQAFVDGPGAERRLGAGPPALVAPSAEATEATASRDRRLSRRPSLRFPASQRLGFTRVLFQVLPGLQVLSVVQKRSSLT